MNREHHHHHHHAKPDYSRAFAWGVGLNMAFVIVEVVYGFLGDSLALLTDAGHNLSDVLGLLLAWGAVALATRKPSAHRTYGFSRATILASLLSGLLLLLAVGAILWEALQRFTSPQEPMGVTMMVVAGIGVIINTATALFFVSGKDNDLNIKGAFLHMAADAAVSLGVVIAGALIWLYGWQWVDPLISVIIAVVIFMSTWSLLRDSINLSIDAVPPGVDPLKIRNFLVNQEGVTEIHDLHIWPMSTTDTALTAHLVMPAGASDQFLHTLNEALRDQFHIHHATIQVEKGEQSCHQAEQCAH